MNFEVIYNRQFLVGVIILVISIVLYVCSKDIVKWILEDKLDVRFQIQLHKYIWEPDRKGV